MTREDYKRYGKYLRLDPLKKEFYAQPYKTKFFGTDNFYKIFIFNDILPEITENQVTFDQFMKVIQKTSKLNHANILRILDFHDFEECYALMMEYFPQEPLITLMSTYYRVNKVIPPVVAVYIATQVCDAFDYVHNQGVIHGNLSPLNVLLTHEGLIKIKDFSIFNNISGETKIQQLNYKQFRYLAPEKIEKRPSTNSSDIYSLGVILYEMLTGQAIYSGKSFEEMEQQILSNNFQPILSIAPHVPETLAKSVEKALAKDPSKRQQSGMDFKREIQKHLIQNNKIFSSQHFYKLISKLFKSQIQAEIEQNKTYEHLYLSEFKNLLTPVEPAFDDYMPAQVEGDLFDDDESTSILYDNVEDELAQEADPNMFDDNEATCIVDDDDEQEEVAQFQQNISDQGRFTPISENNLYNNSPVNSTNITETPLKDFDIKSFFIGLAAGLIVGITIAFIK